MIFLKGVNLYVGDDEPGVSSKHLILDELQLPELEEVTTEHTAGGAIGKREIGLGVLNALTASFKLKGYDPQTMVYFGLGSGVWKPYTGYAALVDDQTGRELEVVARVHGKMTSAKQDAMKQGEPGTGDYEIKDIRYYALSIDTLPIYEYDYITSKWSVNGQNLRATTNSILRIPG